MQLIVGRMEPQHAQVSGVMVEPLHTASLPAHICVACSLSMLRNNTDVILQIMNVSPTPVTLYKGMRLAMATPEKEVLTITQDETKMLDDLSTFPELDQVDISHLSNNEQKNLCSC